MALVFSIFSRSPEISQKEFTDLKKRQSCIKSKLYFDNLVPRVLSLPPSRKDPGNEVAISILCNSVFSPLRYLLLFSRLNTPKV